jgi:hypothetical protein
MRSQVYLDDSISREHISTVLLLRTDEDGTSHWETYSEMSELLDAIRAHVNTVGVSRLEVVMGP